MALSLGRHIVFACFGVAFPAIVVFTEPAHTWAKAMGASFAAGAVSGTSLSLELGIPWPGLVDRFGEVFGFPFVLEGFAFSWRRSSSGCTCSGGTGCRQPTCGRRRSW
ncbi:cytochrome ubiquinol oxidase subunit I [Saccharothrix isguenensis]